jgi:cellulose synthase/poly-beta-1,6-N-acetylglucosamine synthase-like glycosyltransferase
MSEVVDVLASAAVLRHLHRSRGEATQPGAPPPETGDAPDAGEPAARLRQPEQIGQALLRRGLLTPAELDQALEWHRQSGERLGRVLLAAGLVHRRDLQEVLAELWDCRFVDLVDEPPDEELVRSCPDEVMVADGWVPIARADAVVRVATCERPTPERRTAIERILGARVLFEVTTDWDIQHAISEVFADRLAHQAAHGLSERDPEQSARAGFAPWQKAAAAGGLAALAVGAVIDWRLTLIAVCGLANLWFLAAVSFKLVTVLAGWWSLRRVEAETRGRIPDAELPTYTVLVPVYKEANVVGGLVQHLAALDYPREKLEILLLMEDGDVETIDAARAARPPETVRFVVVPPGEPQTKPRACNVGLFFARGEFLVIYDAEDRPEPGQLREAVAAFRAGDERLVCVQARLNYFNAADNVLTRMFTLEYSYWFDYMVPGLDVLGLPIPLGGTSNHFRTRRLRELGGWDAFNVTEDADLGLRANAEGLRVGIISSTTYEEACSRYWPWIRQRTRWIKGYMQTALVHSRRPLRTIRSAGWRGLIGLVLLIAGTPVSLIVSSVLWAVALAWAGGVVTGLYDLPPLFPGPLVLIALFNLVIGNGLMIAVNALAVGRRRTYALLPFVLLNPLYWLLHTVAAWRALYQLVRNPFHWEKTPHGLSEEAPALAINVGHAESVPVG